MSAGPVPRSSHRRIALAVEPVVLAGALAGVLGAEEDTQVVVIDLRDGDTLALGPFDAAVVSGDVDVDANVVIELPDSAGIGGVVTVRHADGHQSEVRVDHVVELVALLDPTRPRA